MSDFKLKTCPFCGHEAKFVTESSSIQHDQRGFGFRIKCSKCGTHINRKVYEIKLKLNSQGQIETVFDEREKAVEEWNKRE